MSILIHPPCQSDIIEIFDQVYLNWKRLAGKRVFITGGTGFIGKWLLGSIIYANNKLNLACKIFVLSRDPKSFSISVPYLANDPSVTLIPGDILHSRIPKQNIDYVIHAATDVVAFNEPLELYDSCSIGTRKILDYAIECGAKSFLLLSSGAIYGCQQQMLEKIPESWYGAPDKLDKRSAYGLGKLAAEWLTSEYSRHYGIEVRIARCFAFVGPYLPMDKHFAIGNFIRDAVEGISININGDGTPIRSYMYATDLVVWLLTIFFDGKSGSAYNVGGDNHVSIKDLAHAVNHALNTNVEIKCKSTVKTGGGLEKYVPDVSLARDELGLVVRVSLYDAIRRTAEWYRNK